MKKTANMLAIILLLILTLSPLNVYASNKDNQEMLLNIKFEDIEEEILKRNPTVKMNENTLASLQATYDLLEDEAEDAEDALDDLDDESSLQKTLEAQIQRLEQEKSNLSNVSGLYPELITFLESQYDSLIGIYKSNLENLKATLSSSRRSLKSQSKMLDERLEDMDDTIDKFIQQSRMTTMQLSWAAENLYITYNILELQESELKNNLELLEQQVEITMIRESLGLASMVDVITSKLSLLEIENSQTALKTQKETIRGELNLLLGQDFDTELFIGSVPILSKTDFKNIDYEADLKIALKKNYSIILQILERKTKDTALERAEKNSSLSDEAAEFDYENEEIKLDDIRKQVALSFYKVYEELLSKKQAHELEEAKFALAEVMKEQAELKHELGVLSDIGKRTELSNYNSKWIKKFISDYELTLAYRKYEWMKRGLTL